MSSTRVPIVFILLFIALCPCVTEAATIVVDSSVDYGIGTLSEECSLRGAILNANADMVVDPNCAAGESGHDDIQIVIPSINLSALPAGDDDGLTGDLDISSFMTITSMVNGGTTFDAGQIDRHIEIFGSVIVNIENIIFTGGLDLLSDSLLVKTVGGSIASVDPSSAIRLTSCSFIDNSADLDQSTADVKVAGAVLAAGQLTLTDVLFQGNTIVGDLVVNTRGGAAAAAFEGDLAIDGISLINNSIAASVGSATGVEVSGGISIFGADAEIIGSFSAQGNVGLQGGCFYVSQAAGRFDGIATADIAENSASTGGFIDSRGIGRIDLDLAGFDIRGNSASVGGVIHSLAVDQEIIVINAGSIQQNLSENEGGVVYAVDTRFVRLFEQTEISGNTAGASGGVIFAQDSDVQIRGGNITNNICGGNGGVIAVERQKTIGATGVQITGTGSIIGNSASGFSSDGGVIWAVDVDVTIEDIVGDISANTAARGGVVFLDQALDQGVIINNIEGEISSNEASSADGAGAVVWAANSTVVIQEVTEGMNDNVAENGDGGIVFSSGGDATIQDIEGGISGQFAFDGGLIAVLGPYEGLLTRITGDIAFNTGFFEGGLLHCSDEAACSIISVTGSITETLCRLGGAIYCEDNIATLMDVSGDISFNEAFTSGGVIYAPDMLVTDVQGVILDNEAVNDRGGAFYGSSTVGTIELQRIFGINENLALSGGAVYAEGNLIVSDVCQIEDNRSSEGDGGFAFYEGTATISNIGSLENNEPDNLFPFVQGIFSLPTFELTDIIITGFDVSGYMASVSTTGGTGGTPTIFWSNGDVGPDATSLSSASFSASATDTTQCRATASFTIAPAVITVEELFSCPMGAVQIGGSPTATQAAPGPLEYSWSPSDPIVSGSNTANPTVGVSEDTTFTVVVSDSLTGVSASAEQNVTIATLNLSIINEVLVCSGDTVQLGGSPTAIGVPSSLTDPIVYTWSPSAGLDDASVANPTLTTLTSGTYSVTARADGCGVSNLELTDSVIVTVLQNSIPFADASPNASNEVAICAGGSVVLGGDSVGSPGPLEYEWTPTTGLDDPTIENPIASPAVTTTYTLRLYTLNRCSFDEDSVTVTVSDISAEAGSNLIGSGILGGFPTASGGVAPYTFLWSPVLGLSDPEAANPAVLAQAGSPYTVTVTDSAGCSATDTVNVVVQNFDTAGELDMTFTVANNGVLTFTQVSQQLIFHISTQLELPSGDVEVIEIDGDGTDFTAVVAVFTFSPRSGSDLVDEYVAIFGCDPDELPCTVEAGNPALADNSFAALTFNGNSREPGSVSIFTTYTFQTTDYSSTTGSPITSDSSDSSADTSDSSNTSSSRDTSTSGFSFSVDTSSSNNSSGDDDNDDNDDDNNDSSDAWAVTPTLVLFATLILFF